MTIWRWDRNPELIALGWPPPMYVGKRKYRSRRHLEKYKSALMQQAIERRSKRPHEEQKRAAPPPQESGGGVIWLRV